MKDFGTAVILAGGKSSRMGFDKNRLSVNGGSLRQRQICLLSAVFDDIVVVSNDEEVVTASDYRLARDVIPGKGPLSGIHGGLLAAHSKFVYFLACDMPYLNLNYAGYMMDRLLHTDYDACVTRVPPHIEPLNAFYSVSILAALEADLLADKLSVYRLLQKSRCLYIEEAEARKFSPDWRMFLNLNTKDDVAKFSEGNF